MMNNIFFTVQTIDLSQFKIFGWIFGILIAGLILFRIFMSKTKRTPNQGKFHTKYGDHWHKQRK